MSNSIDLVKFSKGMYSDITLIIPFRVHVTFHIMGRFSHQTTSDRPKKNYMFNDNNLFSLYQLSNDLTIYMKVLGGWRRILVLVKNRQAKEGLAYCLKAAALFLDWNGFCRCLTGPLNKTDVMENRAPSIYHRR